MLTALAPVDPDAILSLATARVHLNLTASDSHHDAAVTALIIDAIDWVEGYTSQSLQARDFLWTTDNFTSAIRLPIGPVNSVSDITYIDGSGVETALDTSAWYYGRGSVSAAFGTVWPQSSGQPGNIRITFEAGFALPANIPPALLTGVKLALAAMFDNRENPDLAGAMRCCDRLRPIL